MGRRTVSFATGEFYHLYNRGTEKRQIFVDAKDYNRFLQLLYISNSVRRFNARDILKGHHELFGFQLEERLVHIGLYCLMPNHFHIVLTPVADNGVSNFMRKLGTAYSMYFNKKYDRTGTLFEGRFKSQWVDNDVYMRYLYAYVHLNPTKLFTPATDEEDEKAALENFLRNYQYSSLPDYLGQSRVERKIISPRAFPEYFQTSADHWSDLKEWLRYREGR